MDDPVARQNDLAEEPDSADVTAVSAPKGISSERHLAGLPAVTVWTVLALSLPAIIEQLIQAAVGLTDSLIAGHIQGDEKTVAAASAAVGVMAYLQWLANLLNSAFAVGATAIVARSIGARRPRVASRVAGTALAGAFVVGLCTAVGLYVFRSQVASIAGLEGLAHTYGTWYLQIMTITIAIQALQMIGMACLRGAGDTVRPMLITGGVAVINIFTSSSFTFGWFGCPEWGIRGNAFGTMLAYLLGGSATMILLLGGWAKLKIGWRHLRLVPHIIDRLLRIGLPAWMEGTLLWLGQFLIVVFVISANDKAVGVSGATMAAHNTVIRIESLAFLPGFGFGIACSALVGQYLGAGRPDQAERAAKLATRLAVITMAVAAIPMVIMPKILLSIMVSSAPVVALGIWPMVLAGLAQPGFALSIAKGSALKGAGETIWPMISTVTGMMLVRVPILAVAVLLLRHSGIVGNDLLAVWIGIFMDLNFRGLVNWLAFRKGQWKHKRV